MESPRSARPAAFVTSMRMYARRHRNSAHRTESAMGRMLDGGNGVLEGDCHIFTCGRRFGLRELGYPRRPQHSRRRGGPQGRCSPICGHDRSDKRDITASATATTHNDPDRVYGCRALVQLVVSQVVKHCPSQGDEGVCRVQSLARNSIALHVWKVGNYRYSSITYVYLSGGVRGPQTASTSSTRQAPR